MRSDVARWAKQDVLQMNIPHTAMACLCLTGQLVHAVMLHLLLLTCHSALVD